MYDVTGGILQFSQSSPPPYNNKLTTRFFRFVIFQTVIKIDLSIIFITTVNKKREVVTCGQWNSCILFLDISLTFQTCHKMIVKPALHFFSVIEMAIGYELSDMNCRIWTDGYGDLSNRQVEDNLCYPPTNAWAVHNCRGISEVCPAQEGVMSRSGQDAHFHLFYETVVKK